MRADLYNFHTALRSEQGCVQIALSWPNDEARSIANHGEICRSNRGKCSSKFASCSYQHARVRHQRMWWSTGASSASTTMSIVQQSIDVLDHHHTIGAQSNPFMQQSRLARQANPFTQQSHAVSETS